MNSPLRPALTILLAIGFAFAAEPPFTKDGLWSMTTENTMNPGGKTTRFTASMCRNHAHEVQKAEAARRKASCKTPITHTDGDTTETEIECTMGGTTSKMKGTVTVTGENAFHTSTQTTFDPPMGETTEMIMKADMKYVGACPARMEPGDMVMADGTLVKAPKP